MAGREFENVSASEPLEGYWKCQCGRLNVRDFEGLDTCERCGSEVATAFGSGDQMVVKWQRAPAAAECCHMEGEILHVRISQAKTEAELEQEFLEVKAEAERIEAAFTRQRQERKQMLGFREHLRSAAERVKRWPLWKRNLLG